MSKLTLAKYPFLIVFYIFFLNNIAYATSGEINHINKAIYSSAPFWAQWERYPQCNAQPAVSIKCVLKENCSIAVSNELCGDPASGKRKFLYVKYHCIAYDKEKGQLHWDNEGWAYEGYKLKLSCR